jgi:hypothetical protein
VREQKQGNKEMKTIKIELIKDEIESTIVLRGEFDAKSKGHLISWGFRQGDKVWSYSPKNFNDAFDTMNLLLGIVGWRA